MRRAILVTHENRPPGRVVIAANRKGRIVYEWAPQTALERAKERRALSHHSAPAEWSPLPSELGRAGQ